MGRMACVDLRPPGPWAAWDRLFRASPRIEPSIEEPGVFWLDGTGILPLFPSPRAWGEAIAREIAAARLEASVAVGFSRFGSYAVARAGPGGLRVLESREEEPAAVSAAPLLRLPLDPAAREALDRLGVRTLGDLARLPAGGLALRFGGAVARLRDLAALEIDDPLSARPGRPTLSASLDLEPPEARSPAILLEIGRLLDALLPKAAAREEAIWEIRIDLDLARQGTRTERLRPAAPTRDRASLLLLARVRLEAIGLEAPVSRVGLALATVPQAKREGGLYAEAPGRSPKEAARALAILRADLGDAAICRAEILDAHLPEARFAWRPIEQPVRPAPRPSNGPPPLVRRIRTRASPASVRADPSLGPYIVSGGWWRAPVDRAYYFSEEGEGILWIYLERTRGAWFLQGRIE